MKQYIYQNENPLTQEIIEKIKNKEISIDEALKEYCISTGELHECNYQDDLQEGFDPSQNIHPYDAEALMLLVENNLLPLNFVLDQYVNDNLSETLFNNSGYLFELFSTRKIEHEEFVKKVKDQWCNILDDEQYLNQELYKNYDPHTLSIKPDLFNRLNFSFKNLIELNQNYTSFSAGFDEEEFKRSMKFGIYNLYDYAEGTKRVLQQELTQMNECLRNCILNAESKKEIQSILENFSKSYSDFTFPLNDILDLNDVEKIKNLLSLPIQIKEERLHYMKKLSNEQEFKEFDSNKYVESLFDKYSNNTQILNFLLYDCKLDIIEDTRHMLFDKLSQQQPVSSTKQR